MDWAGKLLRIGCCAAGLAACALPASAQEDGRDGWIISVGGGIQTYPRFPGADSYGINPLPIFGVRREGARIPFQAPDDGLDIGLLGRDRAFNVGPMVTFQNKREEDDAGAAIGDVDFTIEAGGFVEYYAGDNFRLRANLRKGVGGHDGLIGDAGVDLIVRDDDNHIFSIGPRLRWANRQYHRAYFGVTQGVASATGLAPFEPGSGIYAVGLTAGYTRMLGRDWGVQAYAGYDRLVGDAADSPIVRALGSRDQFAGGLGLFYNFRIGR